MEETRVRLFIDVNGRRARDTALKWKQATYHSRDMLAVITVKNSCFPTFVNSDRM